jgi:hypothetical protein
LARLSRTELESHLRPRLEAFVAAHAPELGRHSVDESQALSDLYDLVHGESTMEWAVPARRLRADLPTARVMAVAGVAISSVALVIQAAGLPAKVARAIATRVVDAAVAESAALVTTLDADLAAVMNAEGIVDQAEAILGLVGSITNVAGIGRIVDAARRELSSYQWVLAGVVITAQLELWLTTGGTAAAVAELVPFDTAIAGLAISAQQAYRVCHPRPDGLTAASLGRGGRS